MGSDEDELGSENEREKSLAELERALHERDRKAGRDGSPAEPPQEEPEREVDDGERD